MREEAASFREWIARPQVLVGLSALVLSLCGLFISIYETSLVREEQRASVWPHVEMGVSFTDRRIRFHVRNTGVGPARIRTAAVSYRGETLGGWGDLLRSVSEGPVELSGRTFNLLNGRVLPPNSPREAIFEIDVDDVESPEGLIGTLRQVTLDGSVDVTACYCSVYGECWRSSLRDLLARSRGEATSAPATRRVEGCDDAETSGI